MSCDCVEPCEVCTCSFSGYSSWHGVEMDGECGYHDRCYADFDDGEIGEAYDAVGWPCEQLCGRIVVTCKDCPEVCRYNFNRREATA